MTGENRPRWVVDLKDLTIVECNESAAAMWGYTQSEMLGLAAARLIHPDEAERARYTRENHESGDAGSWKCVRKDGSTFELHIVVRRGVYEGRLCAWGTA